MANLLSLVVAGNATFAAPGNDPNAPARLRDLKWVATAPTSMTATGVVGQYHCDGNYRYDCYATNQWARSAVASNWP
jgi:hypothetical protein